MFLAFGGIATAFRKYPVKAPHTGGKLGVDVETKLNQTDKREISKHKTLPRNVNEVAVHKMEYNAAKEKRRAELRGMYAQHLQAFLEAKKRNYQIDANYQKWFMQLVQELCAIDAEFEKSVAAFNFGKTSIQASLSGYQAACQGSSSFRP